MPSVLCLITMPVSYCSWKFVEGPLNLTLFQMKDQCCRHCPNQPEYAIPAHQGNAGSSSSCHRRRRVTRAIASDLGALRAFDYIIIKASTQLI